ncbi:hypothetical protein LTR36_002373 [Oleoguttula mirabilis]|uniref:Eisosome protein 1 n=1 Tax=Oleoguttula mirabilis TaxID=1507867 RepID=A0AAV9JML6_9PEZI|nr:hypothetical protein LTR36_002373 [Oleoguttula mirabilis]
MAAMPSSARAGEVACPDPSAHEHSHKLSEQASTAALYVTDPARHMDQKHMDPRKNLFDANGKLSSSSAATSLKYARPQDLPSYPSSGLNNADSAGKAAMLAKDYKMKDLWQPELSSAGSKAALIAHRDGVKLDLWEPTPSKAGNSAAVIAMRNKNLSPQLDRGYTPDGKQKALMAATLSINRSRSGSQPAAVTAATYPDQHNAASNALNAASVSHRNSVKAAPDGWDSPANQAARIKNIKGHVNPAMYGEHPPVQIEEDEKAHDAALRASAVSMAKQMYQYQNRTMLEPGLTGGKAGADAANARMQPSEQLDVKQEALRYIHLQDAAHKLAQERLAKIDKDSENAKYREYYGYPDNQAPKPRSSMNRLSMGGRSRRRAGSEGTADLDDSDDEQQARRIRSQMNQLNSGLSSVDEKKRTDDRARLMAAAEKKVHAQMHNMDEKIFADTGKVPPAMMEEWEAKARKRAQEDRDLQSRPENKGKTHIGGGKFMDQSEIEAIAAARLKPTLDEINDTAEKKRARDEEIRVDKDREHTKQMEEKIKSSKQKEEWKRVRDSDKAAARKERDEAKARKEEEKRLAKEDKRKSRETKRPETAELVGVAATCTATEDGTPGEEPEEKKRGGLFSRLRRSRKGREEKTIEDDKPAGAVVALGAAGAAAGGVVAGEAADEPKLDDSDNEDELERKGVKDVGEEPTYEAHPAIAVPTIAHDEQALEPTISNTRALRPNIERHLTELADSDESDDDSLFDDDDDDDEFDEPERARNEEELAEKGKNHFAALGEDSTGVMSSTLGEEQTAPLSSTFGEDESDAVRGNLGQYEAHAVAARIGAAPLDGPAETPYAENDVSPLESEHHHGRDAAVAGGVGAAGVAAYEPTRGDETGPAPHTIGPHKSDIANVVDPRVLPDPKHLGNQKEAATGAAPSPIVKTGPDEQLQAQEPSDQQQKGLRGFFSKLRRKQSMAESEMEKPKKSSSEAKSSERNVLKKDARVGAATAAGEKPVSRQVRTDGLVGDGRKTSGLDSNDSATSPSSFKRGEGDLKDPEDASSSGADEDELNRGRGSGGIGSRMKDYAKAEFGFGDLDKGPHPKLGGGTRADDDEDQFEEARDHFDERLAPPPSFAGQKKSESPVRETKFREEV